MAFFFGHSGCTQQSTQALCDREWVGFQEDLEEAWQELSKLKPENPPSEPGRTLSSLLPAKPKVEREADKWPAITVEDDVRDKWARWARNLLDRIQDYLDQLDANPKYREIEVEVTRVANQIVYFHGYCQKGDYPKMMEALKTLKDSSLETKNKFCVAKSQPNS